MLIINEEYVKDTLGYLRRPGPTESFTEMIEIIETFQAILGLQRHILEQLDSLRNRLEPKEDHDK